MDGSRAGYERPTHIRRVDYEALFRTLSIIDTTYDGSDERVTEYRLERGYRMQVDYNDLVVGADAPSEIRYYKGATLLAKVVYTYHAGDRIPPEVATRTWTYYAR